MTSTALFSALTLVLLLWYPMSLFVRRFYESRVAKTTCNTELPMLGVARDPNSKIRGTAVICGGSVAGLLAARVCHDHFNRVLVVEREAWLMSEDGTIEQGWTQEHRRASVMQYYSFHGYLCLGFELLKRLFPNLLEYCDASDIYIGPAKLRAALYGHALALPDDIPHTLFASRQGFETLLRRLIFDKQKYPNIEQIAGTITEIHPHEADRSSVGNISVRIESGETIRVGGTCFIDCMGGTSQGVTWLDKAGYGQLGPRDRMHKALPLRDLKVSYDPKVRYSTMEFPVSQELFKRMNIPNSGRGRSIYCNFAHPWKNDQSVYSMIRDGRIIQLCAGSWGGKLPTDLDGFIEFSESTYHEKPYPEFFTRCLDLLHEVEDQMKCSKAMTAPRTYTRYHLAVGLPNNWIAIGDSVMSLNPIFGHGCTKAAIGALCLNTILHNSKSEQLPYGFTRRFFQLQHEKTVAMWDDTRSADYGHKGTIPAPGETLSYGWFSRWYGFRLFRVAFRDPRAARKIHQASQGIIAGIELVHPSLVAQVLWDTIKDPLAYHK